ncbi:MAG TPA: hypothetical protein VIK60_17830 [Vicinamibacterales bacterium]
MPYCPKCHSTNLRRSPTRSRWERWRKEITGKRPYRCRACHWRGWKSIGIAGGDPASHAVAPDPPNLKGTALARTDPRVELDLKALDRFHNTGKDDA